MTKKILPFKFVSFEWDDGNRLKNWIKHKVGVEECEQVFFNKNLTTYYDEKHSIIEQRWLAMGVTEKGRQLSIFFTVRNKIIRIISARDMSKKEKKLYEK